METKLFPIVIIGLYIFTQIASSLANVTDTSDTYQTLTDNLQTEISAIYSATEIYQSALSRNATTQLGVEVTESSRRKKTRHQQERARRQEYGFSPAKYGLFDMCPPLSITCPACPVESIQAPPNFCDSIVLKVLAISTPQSDGDGRVCGKFGMLKLFGDFNEKEFRRLLRFSVWNSCGCTIQASKLYFLIAPLSSFLKDGLLYNQIVFTEQTILISFDRYVEKEILDALNSCPVVEYDKEVPVSYIPPPVPYIPSPPPPIQPPAPYVPPKTQSPAPYVAPPPAPYVAPPPAPYVAPPPAPYVAPSPAAYVTPPPKPYVAPPPAPYVTPPPKPYVAPPPAPYVPPPAPYVPPPAPYVPPPAPYVPPPAPYVVPSPAPYVVPSPAQYLPITTPSKQPTSRGKMPFLYPSLTKCLVPDTCPVCSRLDSAGDITGQYCVAGFAYLAVIRVPEVTTLQGADTTYSGPTCMNLRTNIIYDITRTRDPEVVVYSLMSLLPTKCLECFSGLSGPVIVLIMGPVPPAPPSVQLDASFQVYILPVPSTIVLPSCDSYYLYGSPAIPYSLLPVAPQPYAVNDCPEAGEQTCPLCQKYPETAFAQACANGFAIVAELNLAGPYFTSQRLPAISVKKTTTYYSKSVEVFITNPAPIECIRGFFKIIQSIGLAPLNFPGEIIPFVSLPTCECLSQGFKRMLIFSSGPLITSQEGYLYLTKDINIAFLQPNEPMPYCSSPPPHLYPSPPPQISPYARPARVPLTYIPPAPPPPAYIPPTDQPPLYLLQPHYLPPPVKEYSYLPPALHIPPQPPVPPATPEPSFEEPIPPIAGCVEFGDGSCFAIDGGGHSNGTVVSINVDENIPFPPPYEALNALIYEDSSVWAPSFVECLPPVEMSCPHSLEVSSKKFEEFYCNAPTALLVAVGIDYSTLGNETAFERRLTFIQPELPYIGIDYGDPNDPVSVKVTVTPNKTMDRRIQLQDNADYCYKEKVVVLADLSYKFKPLVVVGGLDVYIPGYCDSEIFDKVPSYGILLSGQQPSDMKNPVQLTEDFSFIPLPEGRLSLPLCGTLPTDEMPPANAIVQSEKFWVPKNPLESVICELTEKENCGVMTIVQEEAYALPCTGKSAALVLVQNTSAGGSIGPNLEILETTYNTGEKTNVLNVELNLDEEDPFASPQDEYNDGLNRCKYATVIVLKDFSRQPQVGENDVFTVIGPTNCDHPIFKLTNQVVLLLSDAPFKPKTVIPLIHDHTEVIQIPPGTTTISFCNAKLFYEENDGVVQVLEESDTSNDLGPVPAKSVKSTPAPVPVKSVKSTPAPVPVKSVKSTPPPVPVKSVKSTPAPVPVKNTPAPVPIKNTPAPVPVKNTPAPVPVKNTPAPVPVKSTLAPTPAESAKTTSSKSDKSPVEYENRSTNKSNKVLEPSCKGHADDSCPVCGDIGTIPPEVFCKASVSLFSEAFGQEPADGGTCKSGVILSLFDITLRKGVPEPKLLTISYTIPSHCSCPPLKPGGHLFLLLDESLPLTDHLSLPLSKDTYLLASPLKTPMPECRLDDSLQARTKDVDNVLVLDSPFEEMRNVMPELTDHQCPTFDHTCPVCGNVDDSELQDLYCSSEEVLLVSKSKTQKENARQYTRYGKATFTQHNKDGKYALEMNIDKYEGACGLPLAVGNCNASSVRYYYDAEEEMCSEFTYKGCGGNSNNFRSAADCEKNCLLEDFCEEGVLDIKKVVKSADDGNYFDNKFHYALPEHCNCWQAAKGKKEGYLFQTKSESYYTSLTTQLSKNFHFVPLSKNQKKIQFQCPDNGDITDSSENNGSDNEGKKTKPKEKKGWGLFG